MHALKTSFVVALMMVAVAFGQIQISGPQSGTLGPGTYLVVGDIQVVSGAILAIVPGTTFLHNGNHTWTINGQLNANGAEGDSIYFIRQDAVTEHRWGGIRFQSGSSDASTLDYCILDYCYHSTLPYNNYGTAVYSNGADIVVSNSRISNCQNSHDGGGIYAVNAEIMVTNCIVVDNYANSGSNGGGIFLQNCDGAIIAGCVIARNKGTGT